MFYQLINALNCLHKVGIIHSDIKPQNVFYKIDKDQKLTVKIADFDCMGITRYNDYLKKLNVNKTKIAKVLNEIQIKIPCSMTESFTPLIVLNLEM